MTLIHAKMKYCSVGGMIEIRLHSRCYSELDYIINNAPFRPCVSSRPSDMMKENGPGITDIKSPTPACKILVPSKSPTTNSDGAILHVKLHCIPSFMHITPSIRQASKSMPALYAMSLIDKSLLFQKDLCCDNSCMFGLEEPV